MKNLALIIALFSMGCINAQSSSKDIEFYERYENGELVEERKSATENGVPIDGFDFDAFKEESLGKNDFGDMDMGDMNMGDFDMGDMKMDGMNFDSEAKMAEMDQKMKEMQSKADNMFKTKMAEMDQRMKEMQGRSAKMQADAEKRMNEGGNKMQQSEQPKQPKLSPQPQSKPTTNSGTFRQA